MSASWRVVAEWVRATLPRRWRGLVGLVVLVALLGAVAMGALAAARRTQSAYPTYLASSHASNVQVYVYDVRSVTGLAAPPQLTGRLGRLPGVVRLAVAPNAFLMPQGSAAIAVERNDVSLLGSQRGAYFSVDRPVVEQGVMANPNDPHEVVASQDAARLLGWHLGQHIELAAYTLAQARQSSGPLPNGRPYAHVAVTLVGIVAFANEVARDEVDRYPTYVLLTPALTQMVPKSLGFDSYLLTARAGDAGVPRIEREVAHALPPFSVYQFHVTSVVTGQVERAIRPESIALGTFAAIAALAALLIGAQALRRQVLAQRVDLQVLRALGADRVTLVACASAAPIAAVALGALAAAGLAFAASPIAPVGAVRVVDPSPGVRLDVTVLACGVGLLVVVLGALAVLFGVQAARREGTEGNGGAGRSRVADAGARAGLPVPAVMGLRFSFERGAQRSATSVYSVLAAAVVAVVVAVTTVTFASSLTTLTSTPPLYGWGWNDAILSPQGNSIPPGAVAAVAADPQVAAWSGFSYAVVQVDGLTVPLLIAGRHFAVSPPLLAGRALTGPRQIVVGAATAAQLHLRVGDHLVVSYGSRRDYPIWVPPTSMTVVGIATMPAIGSTDNLHTSMGVGAEVSYGVEPPAMQAALRSPDPNQNGPQIVVVRYRHGVTAAAGRAGLDRVARVATAIEQHDPLGGGTYQVVGAQRPAEIVIYQSAGATPATLAIALGVGTVVALGMALASSVRRRRRDLALLKTLGLTRAQLALAVAWQATVVAVVGALIGVPIGIALGRWLWIRFAEQIAAVPEPTVPVGALVVIVLVAVVLANVVAAVPGRVAARTPAALVLRSE